MMQERVLRAKNAQAFWQKTALKERFLREFKCGVAMVNNVGFSGALAMAPWSGIKDSGHGATNSEFALYDLTRPRTLVIDKNKSVRELWWYPFTPGFRGLGLALARFLRGDLTALVAVIKGIGGRWRT